MQQLNENAQIAVQGYLAYKQNFGLHYHHQCYQLFVFHPMLNLAPQTEMLYLELTFVSTAE